MVQIIENGKNIDTQYFTGKYLALCEENDFWIILAQTNPMGKLSNLSIIQ